MIKQQKLEDLIREKVFLGNIDSRGFHSHKCQVCNDYKIRAGFKFENDQIWFNCWNCGTAGGYTEFTGRLSRSFRRILNSYGLEDSEISAVVNSFFFNKKEDSKITISSLTKISTATPTIQLPPKSFPLGHDGFLDYQQKLVEYLLDRKVNLNKYQFFFSLEERMRNRIIIPFYRNGQLIYWQARSLDNTSKKRYDNAPVSRDAVMFNLDQLNRYSNGPLLITEGVFDAMMLDGVALVGSKLTEAKTQLLQRSPRRLVFIIDKDANGKSLAEDVLRKGWEIAFTPDGTTDLNHSVQRFGMSYTIYEIMKSITKDNDASRLAINLYCR